MKNYLLGSKSPRRRELMEMLGLDFKTVSLGDVPEIYPSDLEVYKVPEYLSSLKSNAFKQHLDENDLLITADTVVILDGQIYGKPRNEQEACDMLAALSGKTHHVVTGVTLATKNKTVTFSSVTDVVFAELSTAQIEFYVKKYKPMDKAGAYGIQEWIGAVGVKGIRGSYYNVMGLPIHSLYKKLVELDPEAGFPA